MPNNRDPLATRVRLRKENQFLVRLRIVNLLMRKIVVAIDGFSGTGKSSTAKVVASRLGYAYIDSGAMYRAVTLFFFRQGVDLEDEESVLEALEKIDIRFEVDDEKEVSEIILNGEAVEQLIRQPEISGRVSEVAAIPMVRRKLVQMQQSYGQTKGIVMDGRDIGTVVFPDAELKVFMKADVSVRAKRRMAELEASGTIVELSEIENNLEERDRIDTTRQDSPLVKASDAIEIDTTNLTFQQQVDKIVTLAKQLIDA